MGHERKEQHSGGGNSVCKGPGLERNEACRDGRDSRVGTLLPTVCVTDIQVTCWSAHVYIYPDKYCPPVPPAPPRFHLTSYPSSLHISFTVGLPETHCIMSSFPKNVFTSPFYLVILFFPAALLAYNLYNHRVHLLRSVRSAVYFQSCATLNRM